jgi:CDP-glucose 4,6-dehydratase
MNKFWEGKKVFLTGHTGFKGCWLMLRLEMLGARVFGYSLKPKEPSLYASVNANAGARGVYSDIRNGDELKEAMSGFGPDIVFHLAAQALVRESYRQPVFTYETNVMGTVSLLDAIRQTPSVKSAVIVTTDKCYRDMEWEWGYRETDALGGADPYSSSKACAELIVDAWRRSFFCDGNTLVASARAGNVIGGGDWAAERLVPDAMRAFQEGRPLEIRSPGAVRPWQHVLEPLSGYMILAECLHDGDRSCEAAWNFGPPPEDSRNVGDVAARLAALWGDGASLTTSPDHSLHESCMLMLDSSRAAHHLGWRTRLDTDEAISMTVEWYKRVFGGDDPLDMTRGQIARYMERIT